MKRTLLVALASVVLLTWPTESTADDKSDGCSLGGWSEVIQAGLDKAVLGACLRHDECWAVQGVCGGPWPGLAHKAQCDLNLYLELKAVCTLTGAFLGSSGLKTDDELEECAENCYGAATAAYIGVPVGTDRCGRGSMEGWLSARLAPGGGSRLGTFRGFW